MTIRKVLIIEYVILAALVVFNISIYKNDIYQQLKEWKLVYIPESFTELYFTDHLNLPTTITAGVDQSFLFTLHNLENDYKEYSWEVYAVPDEEIYGENAVEATESTQSREVSEATSSESDVKKGPSEWELTYRMVVASGYEKLRDGETKTIAVSFKPEKVFKREKIEVNLVGMSQTIHYWVVGK